MAQLINYIRTFSGAFETSYTSQIKQVIYALLLFLPTLVWFSESSILLLPLVLITLDFSTIRANFLKIFDVQKRKRILILILLYLLASYLNKLFFGLPISCYKDYYAWFLLLPTLLFTGLYFKDFKFSSVFIFLVVFEVFVCIVEYALQVRTFFLASYPKIDFTSNFLYDYRTFGLSVNSSVVSFKILCALILLELKLFKKWTYYFILIVLYIGAIVTFNRALLLTIFFMNALQFLLSLFADQHKLKRMRQAATPTILFILIFVAFSKNSIWTELNKRHPEKQQLGVVHPRAKNKTIASLGCNDQYQPNLQIGQQLDTSLMLNRLLIRNTAQVNTSGRTLIWANYLQFIHGHLWFGNGSDKLYFKEKNPETGAVKLIHAHNSFLQLLATNGILLSSLLLLILCFIWQRKHLILIITLLFFSVFQYGIFWGFSILDVLLVSLLLSDFERKNEPY